MRSISRLWCCRDADGSKLLGTWNVFVHPTEQSRKILLPEFRVTGPDEAVGAVREPDELDLLAQPFERHEILLRLLYRTAMVGLAVHEKHRSFDIGRVCKGRVFEEGVQRVPAAATPLYLSEPDAYV